MNRLQIASAGAGLLLKTAARTVLAFRQQRLGGLVPLAALLLLFGVVLWVLNAIAPVAPFVYSLI